MEEIKHRYELRKKYLEDPSYRKWSDIAPDSGIVNAYSINAFSDWRDDVLFCYLVTNQSRGRPTASQVVTYLNKGHELPINWANLYTYFDEQLNDPHNRYASYLKDPEIIGDDDESSTSVKKLLDQYRDSLLDTYDMI